ATEILRNVERIVAIELLCAAQGVEFRGPEKLGQGTGVAYSLIRERTPILKEDRVISKDIEVVTKLIRSGDLVEAVEEAVSSRMD
ncbi:MAG: histidine ammonia-lyase, partial [Candidatus Bathyarchaeota archaeon]|nr:histidine ammonia-lyase [Candidatus Bathyarchaeota archaeon]